MQHTLAAPAVFYRASFGAGRPWMRSMIFETNTFWAPRLESQQRRPYDFLREEAYMQTYLRVGLAIALAGAMAPPATAQPAKVDPDWPCQQIKTPTFSLASIWAGPKLDLNSQSWRDESDVADLVGKMAQRRVPIADVEKAIADFKAKAGADADPKLLQAFAAAFDDLSQQRSQILAGLERFGHKQQVMADRIRAEADAVQKSQDQNQGGQGQPVADNQERLQWDLRVFNDRRQAIRYVCDTPTLIEQRIGEIARAVQAAL